jgi:ABC-type spermidine/putrescine transport system permease subunit I
MDATSVPPSAAPHGTANIAPRLLLLPIATAIVIFLACICLVVTNSLRLDSTGQLSLDNFRTILTGSYFPNRLLISVKLAGIAAATCVLLGYPLSLVISFGQPRLARTILFLVSVVFFSDYVMRMYAVILIFGNAGLLNKGVVALGLSDMPIRFIYSELGVIIGLVIGNIAYFVLSCYPSIARIPRSTIEAAAILGARPHRILTDVVVPSTLPGIGAGFVIVFLMCLNSYITPALLGGGFVPMVANVVYDQAINTWRPNLASSSSVVLLAVSCLLLGIGRLWVRRGQR